jgi:protein SCO1/2
MRIQDKFKDNKDVVLLSFTVDPEHDTPSILKQYAIAQKAIPNKWFFITGEKNSIYDLARNSYFATTLQGDGGDSDFVHSEKLILVDKKKQIRGFYDGTDPYETKKLMEDLDMLILEDKAAAEKKN